MVIDNWPAVILSVGHGKEIDEEHDKSCVEKGFQFTWANLWCCGRQGRYSSEVF